ncbi:MAG TPA: peroxiredoxin [Candidatus Babeliales bacterium]|nr:peroxiredoxin [Candidatus Babeliales bacterium]
MEHKVAVGFAAPDFTLLDDAGKERILSHELGKNIALMWVPKPGTPHCNTEVCSIRDGFADLQAAGVEVWCMSYDSPEDLKKFKEKKSLNFPLLSDSDKTVSKLYGVSGWFFPDRVTFLINKQGVIIKILKDVDVNAHAQEIIKAFQVI